MPAAQAALRLALGHSPRSPCGEPIGLGGISAILDRWGHPSALLAWQQDIQLRHRATSPPAYAMACWKCDYPFRPTDTFREWHLCRLTFGPPSHGSLCALQDLHSCLCACANPELRCLVHIKLPVARAPKGTLLPKIVTADSLEEAGSRADLALPPWMSFPPHFTSRVPYPAGQVPHP